MSELLHETKSKGVILSCTIKRAQYRMQYFIDTHQNDIERINFSNSVVFLKDKRSFYFKSETQRESLLGFDIGTTILLM